MPFNEGVQRDLSGREIKQNTDHIEGHSRYEADRTQARPLELLSFVRCSHEL